MPSLSPMQRSLALLHEDPQFLDVEIVEHYRGPVKVDPFGGDLIALFPGRILLIQITDMHNQAVHIKTAKKSKKVYNWVLAGGHFEIWAWRKLQTKGWQVSKTPIGPEHWGLPMVTAIAYTQPPLRREVPGE